MKIGNVYKCTNEMLLPHYACILGFEPNELVKVKIYHTGDPKDSTGEVPLEFVYEMEIHQREFSDGTYELTNMNIEALRLMYEL